jgi:hypothetical protein
MALVMGHLLHDFHDETQTLKLLKLSQPSSVSFVKGSKHKTLAGQGRDSDDREG